MRKYWEGFKKTCWRVRRGVGRCWGKERGNVLGCGGGVGKVCLNVGNVEKCWGKCVKVWGKYKEIYVRVWKSVGGGVGKCFGVW